jgi:hypothetical protein
VSIVEKDRPTVEDERDAHDGRAWDMESWPPPPELELTLDDMLETIVQQAEEDLQRNCIDGLEILIEWLPRTKTLPPEQWQPREDLRRQINEFMDRHFRRVGNKLVFKHPRHRLSSARDDWARFQANPNHIAAAKVRAENDADRRHGLPGKYKGKRRERLQRIVDKINAFPRFRYDPDVRFSRMLLSDYYPPENQASVEKVEYFLKYGRGKRPRDPYHDEDNPSD